MSVKTLPLVAKSDNPEIQKLIDQGMADQEQLKYLFNKTLDNCSAGGAKRILKALVTFQEVNFKKDDFELMNLAEHLLIAKVTIMQSAAKSNEDKLKASQTETNKGEENGV